MSEPIMEKNPLETEQMTEKPENGKTLSWTGGNYSRKAFRTCYLTAGLLLILCIIGAVNLPLVKGCAIGNWFVWLIIPVLLFLCTAVRAWYCSYTIRYVLEEDRLICKKGLLHQMTNTILIPQINDLQMTQSLADRFINGGVGTIIMYTTDQTDPVLRLERIENPQQAFDAIDALRKEYVRRRGIKSFGVIGTDDDGGTGINM